MILIIKTYKFRIYTSRNQESKLYELLSIARFVYNKQLELKVNTYKEKHINLRQFDLSNNLTMLKQENPKLYRIHSQILQNINQRIIFAFNNLYRDPKNKKGFPRFKGKKRYNSLTYPQSGFKFLSDKRLYLSKIGNVNIRLHRKIEGRIKTLTIKRTSTNKWFASFCVEQEKIIKNTISNDITGIDLGLSHFYADSNNNVIGNPRYLRNSEEKLKKLQKAHSRKKKGSINRNKSRLKVARIHEKISNQRNDFLHKESRKLADAYSNIAVEKLKIKNMVKNHYLAKSINDASWDKFIKMLSYKVEETGGKLIEVSPRNTSQYCICGNDAKKTLAVRTHKCNICGINIDRDVMSAMIIKQLAMKGTTAGSAGSNAWGDIPI